MPSTTTSVPGVPSTASAQKVLPVFIIMQLVLSGFTLAGAYWLVHGDDSGKYDRLQDRFTTVIPAKIKGHQKYDSIASIGSETAFATEMESGTRFRGVGDRRTDSTADLTAHAALMGHESPRHSLESGVGGREDEDADLVSLRRVLDDPTPRGGYLQHRRDSLFMS